MGEWGFFDNNTLLLSSWAPLCESHVLVLKFIVPHRRPRPQGQVVEG